MTQKNYQHLISDLEQALDRAQSRINPEQKLSLCMIARNEEEFIAGAIDSVQGVVDEIIVVDTGSTDRTPEIAREHGAKVFYYPWNDDFSAARNESLRHATGDWVLIMDADERIPKEVRKNLRVLLVQTDRPINYLVNIKSYLRENDHSTLSHYVTRMFRKTPETRYFGVIHEQLYPNWGQVTIPEDTFHLIHLGYQKKQKKADKIEQRNIPLIKKAIAEAKDNNIGLYSFYCFYLGSSLTDRKEAKKWLKEALEKTPNPQDATHIPVAYVDYLRTLYLLAEYEEAAQVAEEALSKIPALETYMDFWDAYGVIEIACQNYDHALECFYKVLELKDTQTEDTIFNITRSSRIGGWSTFLHMGLAHMMKSNRTEANSFFTKALEAHPGPDKTELVNRIDELSDSTQITQEYFMQQLERDTTEAPNPYYIQQLSNIYLKKEQPFEALMLQYQAHGLDKMLETALALAYLYEQHNRLELAKQTYNGILSLHPEHFESLIGRMVMNMATAEPEKGYHDYLKLKQLCGSERDRWYQLGELCMRLQQYNEAQECFQELLAQFPDDYESHLCLAYVIQMQGDPDKALTQLAALTEQYPERAEAYTQLGNLYLALNRLQDAESIFRQLLSISKQSDWYTHYALGIALLYQQQWQEAETQLQQALEMESDHPRILEALALLEQQLK